MDLVFVLDSSSSVGAENFGIMINFVKTVSDTLEIAQDAIRVSASPPSRTDRAREQGFKSLCACRSGWIDDLQQVRHRAHLPQRRRLQR